MTRTHVSCGVDLGSTNIKVVAVRHDGTVVARESRPTPRLTDHRSVDAEQVLTLVEDLLIQAAGRQWAIASVCVAGVGEDGVLTDTTGRAIGAALTWFDPRRSAILAELPDSVRAAADRRVTGVQLDSSRTLVGWRWASAHLPDQRRDVAGWVALTDYPATRWTGQRFMSDTLASRTAAWSPVTRSWLEPAVQHTLGNLHLLPAVRPAGYVVGPLTSARLAEASVLAPDAMVVTGGHDHPIGATVIDRIHPGAVLDSMGTAEVVVRGADQLDTALTWTDPAVSVSAGLLGHQATLLAVAELARNLSWAGQSDHEVQSLLPQLLRGELHLSHRPGLADLFNPGEQGGHPPSWAPSAAHASPEDRAAAALFACAAKGTRIVELLQPSADAPVFTTGGWTRSPGWMIAKRRLSPRALHVIPEPEVTGVGAALVAGDAIGWSQVPHTALGYRVGEQPTN